MRWRRVGAEEHDPRAVLVALAGDERIELEPRDREPSARTAAQLDASGVLADRAPLVLVAVLGLHRVEATRFAAHAVDLTGALARRSIRFTLRGECLGAHVLRDREAAAGARVRTIGDLAVAVGARDEHGPGPAYDGRAADRNRAQLG
jgi:hypothetical protein